VWAHARDHVCLSHADLDDFIAGSNEESGINESASEDASEQAEDFDPNKKHGSHMRTHLAATKEKGRGRRAADMDDDPEEATHKMRRLCRGAPSQSGPPSAEEKGKQRWEPPPEDDVTPGDPGPSRRQCPPRSLPSDHEELEDADAAGADNTAAATAAAAEPSRKWAKRRRRQQLEPEEDELELEQAGTPTTEEAPRARRASTRTVQSKPSIMQRLLQHQVGVPRQSAPFNLAPLQNMSECISRPEYLLCCWFWVSSVSQGKYGVHWVTRWGWLIFKAVSLCLN
jgi:hypothetical protein